MNNFDLYRQIVRELTGDENGVRFPDAMIRAGLRLALRDYERYFPRLRDVAIVAKRVSENRLRLQYNFSPGERLFGLRLPEPSREYVVLDNSKVAFSGSETFLTISPILQFMLEFQDGAELNLIIASEHTVTGFTPQSTAQPGEGDSGPASEPPAEPIQTTVPYLHAVTVAKGAAGYALRIRANAVAEVYGKRSADIIALRQEAKTLLGAFYAELAERALSEQSLSEPLPAGVPFPV